MWWKTAQLNKWIKPHPLAPPLWPWKLLSSINSTLIYLGRSNFHYLFVMWYTTTKLWSEPHPDASPPHPPHLTLKPFIGHKWISNIARWIKFSPLVCELIWNGWQKIDAGCWYWGYSGPPLRTAGGSNCACCSWGGEIHFIIDIAWDWLNRFQQMMAHMIQGVHTDDSMIFYN